MFTTHVPDGYELRSWYDPLWCGMTFQLGENPEAVLRVPDADLCVNGYQWLEGHVQEWAHKVAEYESGRCRLDVG